jgi:diamine N-acetyltransferase
MLWRMMLDASVQGRGYGRQAMALIVAHARSRGATELLASCEDTGADSPWPFYRRLGFESTGAYDDGELVIRLALSP